MSGYVPPVGDEIELDLSPAGYTPDVGDEIVLDLESDSDFGRYRTSSVLMFFLG